METNLKPIIFAILPRRFGHFFNAVDRVISPTHLTTGKGPWRALQNYLPSQ